MHSPLLIHGTSRCRLLFVRMKTSTPKTSSTRRRLAWLTVGTIKTYCTWRFPARKLTSKRNSNIWKIDGDKPSGSAENRSDALPCVEPRYLDDSANAALNSAARGTHCSSNRKCVITKGSNIDLPTRMNRAQQSRLRVRARMVAPVVPALASGHYSAPN